IGVLGGSSIASQSEIPSASAEWLERARLVADRLSGSAWEQPERVGSDALRERLGVRGTDLVLFFAGQVDGDVQGFLYGSGCSNADAFGRFVDSLAPDEDLFILGKHHPRSSVSPEEYRACLAGRRGAWVQDVSVHDCLGACDRVASVNSTVMYEALCARRPVLSMGMSLLSGKRIACRLGVEPIGDWIGGLGAGERHERWIEYLAHLLEHHLCAMAPDGESSPMHAASWFAERVLGRVCEESDSMLLSESVDPCLREWTGFGAIGGSSVAWPEVRVREAMCV
ncbi:MAG: capsular polysaccharide export protein, LipB/KpsS family, partial [Planctomycetota bacterium]